jgi:hypothetical protein
MQLTVRKRQAHAPKKIFSENFTLPHSRNALDALQKCTSKMHFK